MLTKRNGFAPEWFQGWADGFSKMGGMGFKFFVKSIMYQLDVIFETTETHETTTFCLSK